MEEYFKKKEATIHDAGLNGPMQTSGRREWGVIKEIRDFAQLKKKQTLQLNKLTDPNTGKEPSTTQDRIHIIANYTDNLYSTQDFDMSIVEQIPPSEQTEEQLPTQEKMGCRLDFRILLIKVSTGNP